MIKFSIKVWQDDEGFIVSDDFIPMYGVGKSLSDAMQDYINSVYELRDLALDDPELLEKIKLIMEVI